MEVSNETEEHFKNNRSEEVQDIIERMPTKFGSIVSLIILSILVLLLLFSWIIRYPDVVSGNVTINTPVSPIKLVANANGKLLLNDINTQDSIQADEVAAIIQNGTSYDTLQKVKLILHAYNPSNPSTDILQRLPQKVALGELNAKYYAFVSSVHELFNFNVDQIYDKQIAGLQQLNSEQVTEINNSVERVHIARENSSLASSALSRDSILFFDKVSAAAEFEKSKQIYLNNKSNTNNAVSTLINAKKEAKQTVSKIIELSVQKKEKQRELELNIDAAYHDLMDNIKLWEQKYLLVAPFNGQVQFLKFWTNNQFVQQGEPVFTIVPTNTQPYGQVLLPALGAGKVEIGQEVILKLNDFPYNEFGSIKGTVSTISLTTNTEKTDKGSIETYLVTIKLNSGLTTNYGKPLNIKHEAKGTAEIITKDRRLLERLFDNLKYAIKK